jgi:hypothetical protein
MRPFFLVLSVAYIAGIFLLADSTIAPRVASYNPYSLFHIPLYGILAVLLVFALRPPKGIDLQKRTRMFAKDLKKPNNPASLAVPVSHIDKVNLKARLFTAGFIAVAVGIADELHQSLIASRDASLIDVLLDIVGIGFVMFLAHRFYRNRF